MKYVGVTHSFNDTDYTDITRFSIGKSTGSSSTKMTLDR